MSVRRSKRYGIGIGFTSTTLGVARECQYTLYYMKSYNQRTYNNIQLNRIVCLVYPAHLWRIANKMPLSILSIS